MYLIPTPGENLLQDSKEGKEEGLITISYLSNWNTLSVTFVLELCTNSKALHSFTNVLKTENNRNRSGG